MLLDDRHIGVAASQAQMPAGHEFAVDPDELRQIAPHPPGAPRQGQLD